MGVGREAPADELRVEVQVAGGRHHVGEGFELGVGVVGAGRRPEVDPPAIAGADVWLIGHGLKPVSVGAIGGALGESNVFVTRYRVVPRRAGMLRIPSVRARLEDESGRSRPATVEVHPPPAEGRPAEFLGGIGRFTLRADASPTAVQVGQELEYRITVEGPAAWGMTGRPELKRFEALNVGLRVEPKPGEFAREPPSRSFVYRLRPTRAGEGALPPVAIAAYDPSSRHYITRVTPSVPVRVVAVPAFNPMVIPDLGAPRRSGAGPGAVRLAVAVGSAGLLAGAGVVIFWVRRRARLAGRLGGPVAARRFAHRTALGLGPGRAGDAQEVALEVISAMIGYLQLAVGRPQGALTPAEAGEGVTRTASSDELGALAASLVARCDGVLYRDAPGPVEDPVRLRQDARELFGRLGRQSGVSAAVGRPDAQAR